MDLILTFHLVHQRRARLVSSPHPRHQSWPPSSVGRILISGLGPLCQPGRPLTPRLPRVANFDELKVYHCDQTLGCSSAQANECSPLALIGRSRGTLADPSDAWSSRGTSGTPSSRQGSYRLTTQSIGSSRLRRRASTRSSGVDKRFSLVLLGVHLFRGFSGLFSKEHGDGTLCDDIEIS
jgi:hypothetical protein